MIPGAVKKYVAPPVPKVTPKTTYAQNTSKTNTSNQSDTGYSFARYASSQYVNQQGVYKLVKRTPQHTFYWGNCTWYVAQYKDVNW
ncbi:MAG: hypothetical protein H6767_09200 [Candidatus Peribacteria bacterium]|nr:MAG: hypothetical protein H6767_09200 [Candidatus Peribacteria bacterium]